MNTLRELISELYLDVSQNVSDDTTLDDRLLIQFINKQRNLWIRNELNKNRTVDANIIQDTTAAIQKVTNVNSDNVPLGYLLYETTTAIPSFLELHHRPSIEQVTPIYTNSLYESYRAKPFKVIDYSNSMYVGNGKFTNGMIFTYPANSKLYLLIPEKGFFTDFTNIRIRGIFEDPTQVTGFNIETSKYPISAFMWNYIKGAVIKEDLRNYYVSLHDPLNNATNDLNKATGNNEG